MAKKVKKAKKPSKKEGKQKKSNSDDSGEELSGPLSNGYDPKRKYSKKDSEALEHSDATDKNFIAETYDPATGVTKKVYTKVDIISAERESDCEYQETNPGEDISARVEDRYEIDVNGPSMARTKRHPKMQPKKTDEVMRTINKSESLGDTTIDAKLIESNPGSYGKKNPNHAYVSIGKNMYTLIEDGGEKKVLFNNQPIPLSELLAASGEPQLEGRPVKLLVYGALANAKEVLERTKYKGSVIALPCTVDGMDVVYSDFVSKKGNFPGQLIKINGPRGETSSVEATLLHLTQEQARMLGSHENTKYSLSSTKVTLSDKTSTTASYWKANTKPHLFASAGNEPISIRTVEGRNRTQPTMTPLDATREIIKEKNLANILDMHSLKEDSSPSALYSTIKSNPTLADRINKIEYKHKPAA